MGIQSSQRRFLGFGLKGGMIGGGCALVLFGLIEFLGRHFFGGAAGEQFGALFGSFSIGIFGYVAVALQIALIAGVTALASRRTVNRTLETFE